MNLMEKYMGKYKAQLQSDQPSHSLVAPQNEGTVVYRNPYPKDSLEARRESLEQCMSATITSIRDQIIKSARWQPSEATRQAEADIEKVRHDVLAGKSKLIDFREACEKWKKSGAELEDLQQTDMEWEDKGVSVTEKQGIQDE